MQERYFQGIAPPDLRASPESQVEPVFEPHVAVIIL